MVNKTPRQNEFPINFGASFLHINIKLGMKNIVILTKSSNIIKRRKNNERNHFREIKTNMPIQRKHNTFHLIFSKKKLLHVISTDYHKEIIFKNETDVLEIENVIVHYNSFLLALQYITTFIGLK